MEGCKILLITPKSEVSQEISRVLEELCHDMIQVARGGSSGLSSTQQNPPDLVICELMMPPPDGIEVYYALQRTANLQDVPFIFIGTTSTSIWGKEVAQGLNVGYLQYPCDSTTLVAIRDTALRGKTHDL